MDEGRSDIVYVYERRKTHELDKRSTCVRHQLDHQNISKSSPMSVESETNENTRT